MKKRFCFLLALFLLFQGNIVLAASYENPDLVEWEAGYLQSLDVERIYAATSTSDGNILIAGQVETKGFMIYDPIVIKMTPDGKILWSKLCYPDVKKLFLHIRIRFCLGNYRSRGWRDLPGNFA